MTDTKEKNPMDLDEKTLRSIFESLDKEALVEIAIGLALSEQRLRHELDDAMGVIR